MGLVSILILMLMLVKHGLEFVHSLVMLLGLFTSKFILIEVLRICAGKKDDAKQLMLLKKKLHHQLLRFLERNLVTHASC